MLHRYYLLLIIMTYFHEATCDIRVMKSCLRNNNNVVNGEAHALQCSFTLRTRNHIPLIRCQTRFIEVVITLDKMYTSKEYRDEYNLFLLYKSEEDFHQHFLEFG